MQCCIIDANQSPCEAISLDQYNKSIYHNELSSNLADYFSPIINGY